MVTADREGLCDHCDKPQTGGAAGGGQPPEHWCDDHRPDEYEIDPAWFDDEPATPARITPLMQFSVIVDRNTAYAHSARLGQVWVGTTTPGSSDICLSSDADGFERMAAALMLAATEMREAQLVAALAPSGQPSTPEVAA